MLLRGYLKQFEGLDPNIEVYTREGFEDDPPIKDFGRAYKVLSYNMQDTRDPNSKNSINSILV